MNKFNTWYEAYNYQTEKADTCKNGLEFFDKLFDTGNRNIDELFFIPEGFEIVLLATSQKSFDHGHDVVDFYSDLGEIVQYGVTMDKMWCRIEAELVNGSDYELSDYDTFSSLEEMIEQDEHAIVVYNNIKSLVELYPFLMSGEVGDSGEEFEDWEDISNEIPDIDDLLDENDYGSDWENEEEHGNYHEEDHEKLGKNDRLSMYEIKYSVSHNGNRESIIVEGKDHADNTYNELIEKGYRYVGMAKIIKVHVSYE